MSEGFDKEAERERLREQLEEDEAKREATQRMSELLLQGATMTNQHCDECGDPIFRWDGTEFCPTCEREVNTGDAEAADEADDSGADAGATDEGNTVNARAAHPSIDAADVADEAEEREEEAASEGPPSSDDAGQPVSGEAASADAARSTSQDVAARSAPSNAPAPADAGDLGEARASLVRTLTALARRAEATDDVGHARELLAGAREAAEALAAVDEVRR